MRRPMLGCCGKMGMAPSDAHQRAVTQRCPTPWTPVGSYKLTRDTAHSRDTRVGREGGAGWTDTAQHGCVSSTQHPHPLVLPLSMLLGSPLCPGDIRAGMGTSEHGQGVGNALGLGSFRCTPVTLNIAPISDTYEVPWVHAGAHGHVHHTHPWPPARCRAVV